MLTDSSYNIRNYPSFEMKTSADLYGALRLPLKQCVFFTAILNDSLEVNS